MASDELAAAADRLNRLAERLRALPESRLARAEDQLGGVCLADACHCFCQWCADLTAPGAAVPRLSDLASGDQVLVLGRELINHLEGQPAPAITTELANRLTLLSHVA